MSSYPLGAQALADYIAEQQKALDAALAAGDYDRADEIARLIASVYVSPDEIAANQAGCIAALEKAEPPEEKTTPARKPFLHFLRWSNVGAAAVILLFAAAVIPAAVYGRYAIGRVPEESGETTASETTSTTGYIPTEREDTASTADTGKTRPTTARTTSTAEQTTAGTSETDSTSVYAETSGTTSAADSTGTTGTTGCSLAEDTTTGTTSSGEGGDTTATRPTTMTRLTTTTGDTTRTQTMTSQVTTTTRMTTATTPPVTTTTAITTTTRVTTVITTRPPILSTTTITATTAQPTITTTTTAHTWVTTADVNTTSTSVTTTSVAWTDTTESSDIATETTTTTPEPVPPPKRALVRISVVDERTNADLAGVRLVMYDSAGNQAASWVSAGRMHLFTLEEGEAYRLEVTEVPEGNKQPDGSFVFTAEDGMSVQVTVPAG